MASRRTVMTGSPAVPLREVVRRLGADVPGAGEAGSGPQDRWVDDPRAEAARRFPVRWTEYYLGLADRLDPADPIRRIAFPEPTELDPHPGDLEDPVGERTVTPAPFVVRKHADRAILLVTARCHVYCRFCFRRTFPDGAHRDPDARQLDSALDWIADQHDLREVILSGGDPLVLPDTTLREIVTRLSAMPQLTQLRLHTRAPVHDPARVTPELAVALTSGLPIWIVVHFDHPREVTGETRRAVSLFLEAGIPMLNQSVLLAGINDDPATLETLCRGLLRERIKPYYLHHPDRVPGAASFYVDLDRGLEIYRELRRRLAGGPALPAYVIDLPDGSGKIPVESFASRPPSAREA